MEVIVIVFVMEAVIPWSFMWSHHTVHCVRACTSACLPALCRRSLSHYIDWCGRITVSKFTMLTALTKGPGRRFDVPSARLIHRPYREVLRYTYLMCADFICA